MRTLRLASLLACCAVAANLYAQDQGRRVRRGNNPPPGATGQEAIITTETTQEGVRRGRGPMAGGMMDRDFAMMLTIGNKGEVEMATFVKDKLQNEQAKQFANQMIQDHSQFLQQLAQFTGRGTPGAAGAPPVGNADAPPPAAGAAPPGVVPQPNQPAGTGVNVAVGGGQGVNVGVGGQPGRSFYAPGTNPMISIKQEIAQECMANAKKELEAKQGIEFDKCYIGMMLGKHAEMVAVLTVLQRHAQDSQFKELLGAGLQKTQHHLEMAKGIIKQLEQHKASQ